MPPTTTTHRRVGRSKLVHSTRAFRFLQEYHRATHTSYLEALTRQRALGCQLREAIAKLVVEGRHINRQLRKMTRLA